MRYNRVLTTALLRLQICAAPPGNAPPRRNCDTSALTPCKGQLLHSWPQGGLPVFLLLSALLWSWRESVSAGQ